MKKIIIIYYDDFYKGINIIGLVNYLVKNDAKLQISLLKADNISYDALSDAQLVINTLGEYYNFERWNDLLKYYENGGQILNIGIKPFTKAFSVENENVTILNNNLNAVHSLDCVDQFTETGAVDSNMTAYIHSQKYYALNELIEADCIPTMSMTCSAYYLLGENVENNAIWMDIDYIPKAIIEPILSFKDSVGRTIATPIVKVNHFKKGSLTFLNFTPSQNHYYSTEKGYKFISTIINLILRTRFNTSIKSSYARYYENETPSFKYELNKLYPKNDTGNNQFNLEILISNIDNKHLIEKIAVELNSFQENNYVLNRSIENLDQGFFSITAKLFKNGQICEICETGFCKISDSKIKDVVENFKPIYIDTAVSTDYCLRDGKPYAFHGVNYHVTHEFRDCFLNFNVVNYMKELSIIKEIGCNVIRTGVWKNFKLFYDDEGNIKEKCLRALEAFFYISALNDMPVQFVLGAFIMNAWDRSKCPIHNPEMRTKSINAYKSFIKRFKGWNNVHVDVLNEPSYSFAGAWQTCRPSGDAYEKKNWIKWLQNKYKDNINNLNSAWNTNIMRFEDASLPVDIQYNRVYYAKQPCYNIYSNLFDFFEFASISFSGWLKEIRNEVKSVSKNTLFIMGRDKSLRVPSQQYETFKKNLDMVNWHQWGHDTEIFIEYLLNRVRGVPCCGQELGVYHATNTNGSSALNDEEYADILERKLLYSLGNWIQWQMYCDHFMTSINEINLGLIRSDLSETKYMDRIRLLSWIEEKQAVYMLGRDEDKTEILTIIPTAHYFSVDKDIARMGIVSSLKATHYNLKLQSNTVLENTLCEENESQIGNPKLIIMPAVQMLSESAWKYILGKVNNGCHALISGTTEIDEYWNKKDRLASLGVDVCVGKLSYTERVELEDDTIYTQFAKCVNYACPTKTLYKNEYNEENVNKIKVVNVGKGKLILNPIPIEIGDSIEPIAKIYEYACSIAGVKNTIFEVLNNKLNLFIYPISYKECTLYTIVNEGYDDTICFYDLESGAYIEMSVKKRLCKVNMKE